MTDPNPVQVEEPNEIVIDAPTVKPEVDFDFEDSSFTDEEIQMAEEQGFKKEKKNEHKEQPEPTTEVDSKKEEETKEVENPTFEDVEKDEKNLSKYGKNEQALYWKWKTDKHKRQEAQAELNKLKEDFGLDRVKAIAYERKLQKINELLTSGEELSVEDLKKVIEAKEEVKNEVQDLQKSSDEIARKVKIKGDFAEKIGYAKYDNFKRYAELAGEMIKADSSGTFQTIIDKSFTDDSVDENTLVERIVNIAKLHPSFSETVSAPKKTEAAERVIKNSEKKISSAAISGGSSKRTISSQ